MKLTPEQNKAICEWAGIKPIFGCTAKSCIDVRRSCVGCPKSETLSDLNTDRLAVLDLLDVLVGKGYAVNLSGFNEGQHYECAIAGLQGDTVYELVKTADTKEAAILAAVLQVMEKELKLL